MAEESGRSARGDGDGDGDGDGSREWPTVDGSLGAAPDKALNQARAFFYAGFLLLPWLWFLNCFYFWPVLRSRSHGSVRPYVLWSGIGFVVYSAILLAWALVFAIGGEDLVGKKLWKKLALSRIVEEYQWAFS